MKIILKDRLCLKSPWHYDKLSLIFLKFFDLYFVIFYISRSLLISFSFLSFLPQLFKNQILSWTISTFNLISSIIIHFNFWSSFLIKSKYNYLATKCLNPESKDKKKVQNWSTRWIFYHKTYGNDKKRVLEYINLKKSQ